VRGGRPVAPLSPRILRQPLKNEAIREQILHSSRCPVTREVQDRRLRLTARFWLRNRGDRARTSQKLRIQ
jgi:hypothetical protein